MVLILLFFNTQGISDTEGKNCYIIIIIIFIISAKQVTFFALHVHSIIQKDNCDAHIEI